MVEEYAAKMALKTDAELQRYAINWPEYREDAVLAALTELAHRGLPYRDEAQLRPKLEDALREQVAHQTAEARRVAEATPEADEAVPALYSPGTITLFSVLFSMIVGGILLGLNLRQLRQSGAIGQLVLFVFLYLVLGTLIMSWVVQHLGLNRWVLSFFDLPAILVYVLWFWPRYVRTYAYQSRSWLLPFLVCAVLKIGLALVAYHYLSGIMPTLPIQ